MTTIANTKSQHRFGWYAVMRGGSPESWVTNSQWQHTTRNPDWPSHDSPATASCCHHMILLLLPLPLPVMPIK